MVHIRWVALDWVVEVRGDTVLFQLFAEKVCSWLTSILSDDDRADIDAQFVEFINQAEDLLVIRDS